MDDEVAAEASQEESLSAHLVDVVVVTWNGRDDTLRALQSLAPQLKRHAGTRVIVVDNGSVDGTAGAVLAAAPDALLIRLSENRGFTGGIAAGVEASEAEYIAFLNNDATVEEGWLDAYLRAAEVAGDDVVAIAGKIVDPSATKVDFVGGVMTFDGHAFQSGFRKPLGSVKEPARGSELFFACGGNMLVRRKPYLELGGFDDDYFAYLEDVDFGWRAWLSGYRIVFEPAAVARHKSSMTSDRLGAFERGVLFERNALQTAIKNFDDRIFGTATAPLFLTLLHRLHRYVVDRNGDTSALVREPFSGSTTGAKGLLERVKSRLKGARIEDPLTQMQFRAMEWFFSRSETIMKKREVIQARRKRSDEEIFRRFPLHVVPTYHGDAALMSSSLFRELMRGLTSTEKSLADIISL